MKFLASLFIFSFTTCFVKASDLIEEIEYSYRRVSNQIEDVKLEDSIAKISVLKSLDQISMDDWILYAKASKNKIESDKNLKEAKIINTRAINNFSQLVSLYQNENADKLEWSLKKPLIMSWWKVALIDDEEYEELKHSYSFGNLPIIEKNPEGINLLEDISRFISSN